MMGEVIPFRRAAPHGLHIEIASPIPTLDMEPAEYEEAWLTLCCYAEEARDYRDYIESRWMLLWRTDQQAAAELYATRGVVFGRLLAFVNLVATLPVPVNAVKCITRQHIRRKRRIIGKVWLRAEGERYDAYRAMLAADEAMLRW